MISTRPLTAVFSASFLGGSELFNLEFLDVVQREGIPVRALVPAAGGLMDALLVRGIPVEVVPIPSTLRSMSRFDTGLQLGKFVGRGAALASYGPHLTRCLSAAPGPLCALGFRAQLATAVAAPPRRRIAWIVHEVVPPGPAAIVWRQAARRSSVVVTYSRTAADQPALRAARAEVHAVRFDLDAYTMQPPPQSPPQRIGLVGDLVELKNHRALIAVVDRLRQLGLDARGILIGRDVTASLPRTAGYVAEVRRLVNERPTAVELKAVEPAEMPAAVAEFDLLLHASTVAESFGRVCIEAMAAGRPVVAFNHGALAELVEDGRTGLLCPVGDLDAVTEAIRELFDDPDRHIALSAEAKRLAVARYGVSDLRDTVGDALARFALRARASR